MTFYRIAPDGVVLCDEHLASYTSFLTMPPVPPPGKHIDDKLPRCRDHDECDQTPARENEESRQKRIDAVAADLYRTQPWRTKSEAEYAEQQGRITESLAVKETLIIDPMVKEMARACHIQTTLRAVAAALGPVELSVWNTAVLTLGARAHYAVLEAVCVFCATSAVDGNDCHRDECCLPLHPNWPTVYCSRRCAENDA
jgi:hypothetical protein